MKVVAEGTGPASGLPDPDCSCAGCRKMRREGSSRAPARLRIERMEPGDGPGVVLDLGSGPSLTSGVLWAPSPTVLPPIAFGDVRLAVLGGEPIAAARTLALLRASGALRDDAECWLVAVPHGGAPAARRRLLVDAWGMTEAVDGQTWAGGSSPVHSDPERVLVIGGSASGKSQLAEDLLAAAPAVVYVATGPAARPQDDADWAERIQRHRERRPASWRTRETADPTGVLTQAEEPILLDSLGSWLTGVLDRTGAWDDVPGWRDQVEREMAALVAAWSARSGPAIAVTDEVGWGVVPATSAGRRFRDLLGQLNQRVADASDRVLIVVAGQVLARAGDSP